MKKLLCVANGCVHSNGYHVSVISKLEVGRVYYMLESSDSRYFEDPNGEIRGDHLLVSADEVEFFAAPDDFFKEVNE